VLELLADDEGETEFVVVELELIVFVVLLLDELERVPLELLEILALADEDFEVVMLGVVVLLMLGDDDTVIDPVDVLEVLLVFVDVTVEVVVLLSDAEPVSEFELLGVSLDEAVADEVSLY
jgi:hypothetical protein